VKKYDFIVIGGGVMGVFTAYELVRRGHKVALVESGPIPNALAASTDISKIIRMEYGSDVEYMEMAIESMQEWKKWNQCLGEEIYREVGFLLLATNDMEDVSQAFEMSSYTQLIQKGYRPERLGRDVSMGKYPSIRAGRFRDGFYHGTGGYGLSGLSVKLVSDYCKTLGLAVFTNGPIDQLVLANQSVEKVVLSDGSPLYGDQYVLCTGNITVNLLPDLAELIKVTGHPVFHIKPSAPALYTETRLPVFAADISNTGWYGFPLHPTEQVVKIARHSEGRTVDPITDRREVSEEERASFREFVSDVFPGLRNDPIVYTRLCCYTDTIDGHFLIDRHPDITNLTVGTGGSGHGFKMGPVIGRMIADRSEGKFHARSGRYNWRKASDCAGQEEEARFVPNRHK
jgi:glycine/D-amino acid oxidase-like deaminating enzyme